MKRPGRPKQHGKKGSRKPAKYFSTKGDLELEQARLLELVSKLGKAEEFWKKQRGPFAEKQLENLKNKVEYIMKRLGRVAADKAALRKQT